ncbi:MAG TPA: oxidoreductase [Terriglobales bacterium]|nr:oxidoreductase [Terriglobales bacterium]
MGWDIEDMPDLRGKVIAVTGGNSGIGYEAAAQFARNGAQVVLACRDAGRAGSACDRIRGGCGEKGAVEPMTLDLADLGSVQRFAAELLARYPRLDVLVNNAGVMALPYCRTADGFEMQFGTNHLGHFALTGHLLPRLLATPGSRVVNVSSTAHRIGKIDFDDLQGERRYSKWPAYGQSKLANLLFTYELQRRLAAAGKSTIAVACHPGYASTNLQGIGPKMAGSSWMGLLMDAGNRLFAQSAQMGAMPTMYAATAPEVQGGDYIGPGGFGEVWGPPVKVKSNAASQDRETAKRLWQVSEELTGVAFAI